MTMFNQAAVEALCSATYLENYLETMESLPDDLQRCVTALRELDIKCRDILQDMDHHHDTYTSNKSEGTAKKKAFLGIQRALIKCQEIGDEKLHQMSTIIEIIENRQRQLDQDRENLDPTINRPRELDREECQTTRKETKTNDNDRPEKSGQKRQRRQKNSETVDDKDNANGNKKKKKRKVKKERPDSPIDPPIDPDEPRYCLCNQVSYGEMIGCDNDKCQIEWFHFNCVNLSHKPKGKWYCPRCRGDKPTVKKPDK
ncbi:inhibitor of growth protein 1 [Patella vulgata]|uniref:inhibitor of growth protein 1 n=1 Tax=Patella vulgata TaxID=6465 RepID=UPI0024A984A5|nr:inhibitor of growth protein 1 [Patella vulgata]